MAKKLKPAKKEIEQYDHKGKERVFAVNMASLYCFRE